MKKNKGHWCCKNCNKLANVPFSDDSYYYCGGIVKHPKPKFDVVRFCIVKNGKRRVTDLAPDEAIAMSTVLNSLVHAFMQENKEYQNFRNEKKE